MSSKSNSTQTPGAPTEESSTVKIKLSQAHTHARKDYKAGDEIEVDAATAKWIVEHKIGVKA